MVNEKRSAVKIGKILSFVLVCLIFITVCGSLVFLTNGFTTDIKPFYVVCNGEKVVSTGGGYYTKVSQPLNVNVSYTLDFASKEVSGYSVKIIPNTENDFDFLINGMTYSFCGEQDYTEGFNIEKNENSFTLEPKGNLSEVIKSLYPDMSVFVDYEKIDFTKDLFIVVVSSYNGESNIYLSFSIENGAVPFKVKLNMEEITL